MEKKEELEGLRKQVLEISKILPKGSNTKVSVDIEISTNHLYKIRLGINITKGTSDNIDYMRRILDSYKRILEEEKEKLNRY